MDHGPGVAPCPRYAGKAEGRAHMRCLAHWGAELTRTGALPLMASKNWLLRTRGRMEATLVRKSS